MPEAVDEKYKAIEKAFSVLELQNGIDDQLCGIIKLLAEMSPTPGTHVNFQKASKAKCKNELMAMALQAKKLSKCLEQLHQPSILALADAGFWKLRTELTLLCQQAVEAANLADVSKISPEPTRGRPREPQSYGIAKILAYEFQRVTGKSPTISVPSDTSKKAGGPFIGLIKAVFSTIGINASHEAVAKQAIKDTREGRGLRFRDRQLRRKIPLKRANKLL